MRRRKELDLYELPNGVKVRRPVTKPTDVRENSNGSERKPLPANELSSSHPPAEDPSPRLCPHQKSSSMDSHLLEEEPEEVDEFYNSFDQEMAHQLQGGQDEDVCEPITLTGGYLMNGASISSGLDQEDLYSSIGGHSLHSQLHNVPEATEAAEALQESIYSAGQGTQDAYTTQTTCVHHQLASSSSNGVKEPSSCSANLSSSSHPRNTEHSPPPKTSSCFSTRVSLQCRLTLYGVLCWKGTMPHGCLFPRFPAR